MAQTYNEDEVDIILTSSQKQRLDKVKFKL